MKMNKAQLNIMATRLNFNQRTINACEMVLIHGHTAYFSEQQVYGKRMGTIGRACKRLRVEASYIREAFYLSQQVCSGDTQ